VLAMAESMLEYGRNILSQQPFSVSMGVELDMFDVDLAELSL